AQGECVMNYPHSRARVQGPLTDCGFGLILPMSPICSNNAQQQLLDIFFIVLFFVLLNAVFQCHLSLSLSLSLSVSLCLSLALCLSCYLLNMIISLFLSLSLSLWNWNRSRWMEGPLSLLTLLF